MFRFGEPQLLYLLVLLPLLLAFLFWVIRSKRRGIQVLVGSHMAARLTGNSSSRRQWSKGLLVVAAVGLLFGGLARPQFGTRMETVEREGQDLVVVLDLSASMLAGDIQPNRLEKARHAIGTLIGLLEGDRIGIVGFAGEAFVQCPLTLDYGAARTLLASMGPESIPVPGTALGEALRKGLELFSAEEKKHKVMVLITDGEDHLGRPLEVAREAAGQGVVIHAVGIGSMQGTPIPVFDSEGRAQGFKKNRSGEVVMTRLDESTLRQLAEETGGTYHRASPGESELEGIYTEVAAMDKKQLASIQVAQYEERFQIPVLLGLVLLLADVLLAERRRVDRVWRGRFR